MHSQAAAPRRSSPPPSPRQSVSLACSPSLRSPCGLHQVDQHEQNRPDRAYEVPVCGDSFDARRVAGVVTAANRHRRNRGKPDYRRGHVRPVASNQHIKRPAIVSAAERQPVRDQPHPFRALYAEKQNSQHQRNDEPLAQQALAVLMNRSHRQIHRPRAPKQHERVHPRHLDRQVRQRGRRPERRRHPENQERHDQSAEQHHLRRNQHQHREQAARNELLFAFVAAPVAISASALRGKDRANLCGRRRHGSLSPPWFAMIVTTETITRNTMTPMRILRTRRFSSRTSWRLTSGAIASILRACPPPSSAARSAGKPAMRTAAVARDAARQAPKPSRSRNPASRRSTPPRPPGTVSPRRPSGWARYRPR